jgi:tol-pal system protein YbgF
MQLFRPVLFSFLAVSTLSAASREIVELQRDVASLQEQVRTLQRTIDERMAALTALVQQSLEQSSKTNTSVAVLESGLRDRLSQQLITPVANLSTKVDQMSTDFNAVRETMADLNERVGKIQTQIVDLGNTVKVLQSPPAPPPSGPGGSAMAPAGGPPPGMSAKQVYDSALRDRLGGNLDLAMQGFEEYLKWYSTTELAPNAQFYIGEIFYDKNDFDSAVRAYDAVIERFPENNKTPDAMYKKGMALLKSGQRNQAGQEFLTLIQKYPSAEVTAKAKAQRKALGLSVPTSASAPAKRRR